MDDLEKAKTCVEGVMGSEVDWFQQALTCISYAIYSNFGGVVCSSRASG